MRKINNNEVQGILLDILKALDGFCRRKSLRYFLSDGTLLGAVRHGGFIPWDDDIDVSMIDAAYDEFLSLARQNPYLDKSGRYKVLLPGEMPNFYPFAKIVDTKTIVYEKDIERKYSLGAWVDVFRLSRFASSDAEKYAKKFKRMQRLKTQNKLLVAGDFRTESYRRISPLVTVGKSLCKAAGASPELVSRKIQGIERSFPMDGDVLLNATWANSFDDRWPVELWADDIELKFEGAYYCAPAQYDAILKIQYGDYMKLPPADQRIRHDFEAYWV